MLAFTRYCRTLPVSLCVLYALTGVTATQAQTVAELDNLMFHPAPYPLNQARQAQATFAGNLLLATAEDSLAGITLPESPSIARSRHNIAQREEQAGPFAPELFEDLLALGLLLQEAEAHGEALDVLQRAAALGRMHSGLYAPELITLSEHMIDSLTALGDLEGTLAQHEYLVHLHRQLYGNEAPQTAHALLGLGEWQLAAFHQRLLEPQNDQSMLVARDPGALYTGYQVYAERFGDLYEARQSFVDGIRMLIEQGDFADPALYELEQRLLQTFFIDANRELVLSDPRHYALLDEQSAFSHKNRRAQRQLPADYRNGEQAYLRLIGYLKQNPEATVQQLADVMLQLADWHLMFGKYQEAGRQYEKVEAILARAGFDEATIDAILRPAVPPTLPGFMETAISAPPLADPAHYRGHVDVMLNLNRYGRVGKIEVIGSSAGTSELIEGRLVSLVRHAQFRPTPGRSTRTGIRYHYTY